jgi:trehalose/maltose hydrolase-like predicted phosphorylase
MINTTDLQEVEISLPGDWTRQDNKDVYSFTTDKMELKDEMLFRQLNIRRASGDTITTVQYALLIKDDYVGIQLDEKEYIIRQLNKNEDGSASMEWEDSAGISILFTHA